MHYALPFRAPRAHTLALHGPDGLHLHLRPEDRAAVFASIDVERAECFRPDDKVRPGGRCPERDSSVWAAEATEEHMRAKQRACAHAVQALSATGA